MTNILRVENIDKYYGSKQVLQNFSLTMNTGQTIGLLGPNGAGKTTALDLILGIKKQDHGSVTLQGESSSAYSKKTLQTIGVQFQHSFYPGYITLNEVCQMTSCLYEDTIDYQILLEKFNLSDKGGQKVQSLSGGEKQKLAVLLALINKPKIVFLDELTTGLDPQARREVWGILKEEQQKGLSILLTSHYMDEVEQLCDEIVIIDKGQTIFEGTTESLKTKNHSKTLEDAYLNLVEEQKK